MSFGQDMPPLDFGTAPVMPAGATPQIDSTGAVVGYYSDNGDGTVTVWDAGGANPITTQPSATGLPVTTSGAGLFSCRPESFFCFGWDPATQGYRFGAPAAASPGYVPPSAGALTGSTLGTTLRDTIGGAATGLGMSPTLLWVGLGALALLLFAGPELAVATAAGAARSRRRRNPYGSTGRGSTATRTEVRSPTRTSTSTKADTRGNLTVTGGAGDGDTIVRWGRNPPRRRNPARHASGLPWGWIAVGVPVVWFLTAPKNPATGLPWMDF
jgi:hypothetical protein